MGQPRPSSPPELWAGVECTVNRIGDEYLDQLELSGHARRISDLELFAELGVRALRQPVLWERVAPLGEDRADWSWSDARLGRLRELEIRPIVGLLHHGSGPRYTSLLDPEFPRRLARFARACAERYPWVEDYTPVNEPLTTARFSALYGHWYPHARDGLGFARALLAQCRGTVLAMRAIREVSPCAALVQTDDLGKTRSTAPLGHQADFENERRWLGWDLLCGRVDQAHPMWAYLRWLGVDERELGFFLEHRCAPDVIGINHYITSERFLDHRLERYPEHTHGGNGCDAYADVEAVRVCSPGLTGWRALLREAWERYAIPLAVTEVHLGCTREEQLRWFRDAWVAACRLRREHVDVRAVTAWSLLGAYGWENLLTRRGGRYEPGVYDLRAPRPRATALAKLIRKLADGGEPDHPLLEVPGWWRRPHRVLHPPARAAQASAARGESRRRRPLRRLLITGATGTLGRAFARICHARGIPHHLLGRRVLDIADRATVERVLDDVRPWAVVNTAGYVRVDDAELEPERCRRENSDGPALLAAVCAQHEIPLLTYSSDLVFDGERTNPYREQHAVRPLNEYGRSKAEAERRVLEALPSALVIRTSAFFGPWDRYNFVTRALRALSAGEDWIAADDAIVSPTYVPDLVHTSLDLLIDGESGIWHLANGGALSWLELATRAAELARLDTDGLAGRPTAELGLRAPRPIYSVLGSERGMLLPSLDDALSRYLATCDLWRAEEPALAAD